MNDVPPITVTIAGPDDVPDLVRVEIQSKRASIPHLVDAVALDPVSRAQRWRIYLRGEAPVTSRRERRVFKSLSEGGMVGYIAGHLTTRWDMDAEIQSFYVLRTWQRQGIGSALFSAMAEWLVASGARRVCVGIAAENPYRGFYEKHGARYLNPHWMYWSDIRGIVPGDRERRAES